MTIYNSWLLSPGIAGVMNALSSNQFIMILLTALVIECVLVAPVVKKIVSRLTNEHTPFIKRVMLISALMVLFMCASMSLVATLIQGYQDPLLLAYGKTFLLNLVMAFPLQFLIVGPIARAIFFKLFPPAVAVAIT
ncbi:DUF2798 domain-containing protein [Ferrimonas lipolytica]|uniref:DUF2798 domain-containing protein n=1 Tax=Ferrimonas lipolytica TaxID=2724191 RepID=A0A6H1UBP3_9GAMM|nr:DUF2798 domain-containing protein [Ferrimonas lipolytica]QIZ76507.1 DUF2798 domain-containing protein [Ferrimonas lipolytica]